MMSDLFFPRPGIVLPRFILASKVERLTTGIHSRLTSAHVFIRELTLALLNSHTFSATNIALSPIWQRKFSSCIVIKSEYFIVNRRSIHIWTLIEANAWGVGHASLYIVTLSGPCCIYVLFVLSTFSHHRQVIIVHQTTLLSSVTFANLMFGNVKSFKGGSSLSSWHLWVGFAARDERRITIQEKSAFIFELSSHIDTVETISVWDD